ncbi:protein phosphatase 2C domain-containing protein [uncultured Paludibaculum sp.]|uniref:PP2C family protein-serine/threonine phosphatase n=1 Tax=uncultured Paludibaculum sp. TaxID=1765020 RepID=UPI002AAADA29|nr:protein phosphatase 2C domain-containing protein [uncultured Paludibaculum sp.]
MPYLFGNAQHVGRREYQQDAFGFSNPFDEAFTAHAGLLAVVADGMGGLEHGEAASRAAVQALLDAYRLKTPEEPIGQALDRGIRSAQQAVLDVQKQLGLDMQCGTTLVAAVWFENQLHWVAAGDSALYLCRQGQWTRLNELHTYGRHLDSRAAFGEITKEQADADPQREALTSYLGISELNEIDRSLRPITVVEGDWVLLASDGLYKSLSLLEVPEALHGTLQERCDTLLSAVLARGLHEQDNVTVVALAYDPGRVPLTVAPQLEATIVAAPPVVSPAAAAPPLTLPRKRSRVPLGALVLVLALVTAYFVYRTTCCAGPPPVVAAPPKPVLANPNPPVHTPPEPPKPNQLRPPQ